MLKSEAKFDRASLIQAEVGTWRSGRGWGDEMFDRVIGVRLLSTKTPPPQARILYTAGIDIIYGQHNERENEERFKRGRMPC
jgi:hypothetical protein